MNVFKVFLVCSSLFISVTNCASQKMDKTSPVDIKEIYQQHWVSGVKGGGSGTNIFVILENGLPKGLELDSIYFKSFELQLTKDSHISNQFIARNVEKSTREYGLRPTTVLDSVHANVVSKPSKFQLEDNECVIQYTTNGKVKYFKYDNLKTKDLPLIPTTLPNSQ